jgi:hypothetical protein
MVVTSEGVVGTGWATSISTVQSATTIIGTQLNGWNFVPTTTTIFSSSTTAIFSSSTTPPSSLAIPASTAPLPSNLANATDDIGVSLGTIGILSICFAIWYIRRRRPASPSYAEPQAIVETLDSGPGQMYEMESIEVPTVLEMEAPGRRIGELPRSQLL